MNIKNALLTAAVGGILAGVTGCGGGATPQPNSPAAGSDATPAAAPAKHSCTGSGMDKPAAAPAPAPAKQSCAPKGGDDSSGGDMGGGASGN